MGRDVTFRSNGREATGYFAPAPGGGPGVLVTEPDEAGKLMMSLNLAHAGTDMSGAVDFLLGAAEVTCPKLGVVGFCMGGALALMVASQRPDAIAACAPYHGVVGWLDPQPDWAKLRAVVLGQDASFTVHEGTDHAFFNDTRPDVYAPEASAAAWADTLDLFTTSLVDG